MNRSTVTKFTCIILVCCLAKIGNAQKKEEPKFVTDTMSIPGSGKVLEGDYIETVLKDQSAVRFFRTNDNHYYLRFLVRSNFYFGKTDVLEIQTGNKSYYAKEVTQHKVSKTSGLFLTEVFKNYLSTLKDGGITGLVFNKAETDFTRQDTHDIRMIAGMFYDKVTTPGK